LAGGVAMATAGSPSSTLPLLKATIQKALVTAAVTTAVNRFVAMSFSLAKLEA